MSMSAKQTINPTRLKLPADVVALSHTHGARVTNMTVVEGEDSGLHQKSGRKAVSAVGV
ncbi:uncharacterized protein LACBIDRAFT_312841 [Laccaria bicolor S238N-H82]|uniref:Predicted protein n=1 Tax=Laccaria bicolor (strain S238N-H82 / ATCC MYA-4686) TaxID=486041 RepID=B0DWX6_LACBS|nr:uncharacterized protein LACBIDRAFT_312841 [Laccaria bicolor S238N-H82]EDR00888.1 predicted protein [Laccaria bicolor S238N-H82]|eukprot:XP_001888482.1 predicted protein [Laccaria bicolor S238N-H82]